MKQIIFILVIYILGLLVCFGTNVTHFQLKVNPNPTRVGIPVELSISALNNSNSIVKDYIGDLYIQEPVGLSLSKNDVKLVDNQIISFRSTDQGIKKISNIVFYKTGTYNIIVHDIIDDQIKGNVQIQVGGSTDLIQGEIRIISPSKNKTITGEYLTLQGKSTIKEGFIDVILNGTIITKIKTNKEGNFSRKIDSIVSGNYSLLLEAKEKNNLLAQSSEINFKFFSTVPKKIELSSLQKKKLNLAFKHLKNNIYSKAGGNKNKLKILYATLYKKIVQQVAKYSDTQRENELLGLMAMIKKAYSNIN